MPPNTENKSSHMVTGIQSASFFQPLSKQETATNTVVTVTDNTSTGDALCSSSEDEVLSQEGEQERELKGIYSEMRTRQRAAILQAGVMRADASFDASQRYRSDDDRRCLAVSAILDDHNPSSSVEAHWSPAYHSLQARLERDFGPDGFCFAPNCGMNNNNTHDTTTATTAAAAGQLHWTVLQLVGFADYETHITKALDGNTAGTKESEAENHCPFYAQDYLDCVQDSLAVGGLDQAITITYIGVIAVSTGLLMVGVPSKDSMRINDARDLLRDTLQRRDLPLMEPFCNNIVHSTLFRVTNEDASHGTKSNNDKDKEDLHMRLLNLAKEYEEAYLGTVTLDKFQVGPASWRMRPDEMQETPPWRTWTLPQAHASDAKNAHEPRLCYTVSGAAGDTLAKEILQVVINNNKNENVDAAHSPVNSILLQQPITIDSTSTHSSNDDDDSNDPTPIVDYTITNAATLTGAGGLLLAQEVERIMVKDTPDAPVLDDVYFKDFH